MQAIFGSALPFGDARLEAAWQVSQEGRRRIWDAAFFVLFSISHATSGKTALQVDGNFLQKIVNPVVLAMYLPTLWLIKSRPETYSRLRTTILSLLKTANAAVYCVAILINEPTPDTWPQFVRFELLLYQKGLFTLIQAVTLPLPFCRQCAVQAGILLLYLLHAPAACAAFHARQPSNYGRYRRLVAWLDAALLPAAGPRQRACPLAECGQAYCMHVQALLTVVVGFVLPILAVFAIESRARRRFLLSRPGAGVEPRPPGRRRCLRLGGSALCLANCALGVAVLWHWLGFLLAWSMPQYSLRPVPPN